MLRLYSSPSEILSGFDVDACAVGYDGTQVYNRRFGVNGRFSDDHT